jgi:hypothetical protein
MISILVVPFSILCFSILFYRHQVRKRRRELLLMKRHANSYVEEHKSA